jgi:hypothetical protein
MPEEEGLERLGKEERDRIGQKATKIAEKRLNSDLGFG